MDATKPNPHRPPGVLTEKDRLYLQGEDVPESKQALYERRKGVRQRIKNGLLDFQEFWDLDAEERKKITSDLPPDTSLYTSLVHMFAFLRFCALDEGHDLEKIVASGVELSRREEGSTVVESEPGMIDVLEGVTVTIAPRYHRQPNTETILEKFREGTVLSHREMVALIGSGLMTEADWDRLREEYGPESGE